jgi:hypothetical protein
LFSYDDKWVSVMERPKACGDHPIRWTTLLKNSFLQSASAAFSPWWESKITN